MEKKLQIKICGITDKNSLRKALELEVDYVGLIFFSSSPRNISLNEGQKLLKIKNDKTNIVALTVDADDSFLEKIVNHIKPDYFQFHGLEDPKRCIEIKNKYDIKIIKALEVDNLKTLLEQISKFKNSVDQFIFDTPKSNLPGGNGIKFKADQTNFL